MIDTIAARVTRVIGGSVHALLDVVEHRRRRAMAQAIREVDQAMDEVRAEWAGWRTESASHVDLNKLTRTK